ncbi:AlpA family transcriptional regulator [Azospirillum baldaniorum]|uniref:helix-turn-helix transcriptional regulator n=1 Tax=Azospirillum baldaniorum TaxID=1064539 RepID=UPI0011AC56C0|nr:helix-turn-helix domain-containing protein [Azospirillum baldaniorum]TWA69762.1 AlpA family transcriptional regulator [Azospirillum baldaniorum]
MPMLNEEEAAALLNLAPKTLTRWRWKGVGPAFVKVGARAVRYREEDLQAFLEAGRQSPVAS